VLEINMPENVEDVYIIADRELVFKVITELGETEIVFFSDIDITIAEDGDLTDIAGVGRKKVEIKSEIDEADDDRNKVFIRKFVEPAP
jgi:vacuolar-type H+-ATPase subunit I/STV1